MSCQVIRQNINLTPYQKVFKQNILKLCLFYTRDINIFVQYFRSIFLYFVGALKEIYFYFSYFSPYLRPTSLKMHELNFDKTGELYRRITFLWAYGASLTLALK